MPSIRRSAHPAEVGHHEHAHGVAAELLRELAARGADAALEVARDHPGAAADAAFVHRTVGRAIDRLGDVLLAHVAAGDVVEPGVVALADQRDDDVVLGADARVVLDHLADGALGARADAERVREQDWRLDEPPLDAPASARVTSPAPFRTKRASDDALVEDVARRSGGSPSRRCARDHAPPCGGPCRRRGGVSDAHAGDVGDRVVLSRRVATDHHAEVSRAATPGGNRGARGARLDRLERLLHPVKPNRRWREWFTHPGAAQRSRAKRSMTMAPQVRMRCGCSGVARCVQRLRG